MNITKIPTQELIDDRLESINDIKVCQLALLHGNEKYSGGSVHGRIATNKKIITAIDTELNRRSLLSGTP